MQEGLFAAHHALEERHWWFRARRRALLELGTTLLPPDGRIVDVGCGTGADVASFSPEYHRYGIDVSETAIAFARERHDDVEFEVGALPGAAADTISGADLVLLCDVLEHVEHHEEFLSWLLSTMKRGSHLLITVPADPRLWSPHDEVYGHYRRYTAESLAALWAGLPVTVRLLAPFNRILYPVARVARSFARRRGRSWGSEQSDLGMPWAPLNWLLERLFSLEVPALRATLESDKVRGTSRAGHGVSLIAVLRVEDAG
jgi:SAM-dependent methyltransferase